MTKLQLVQSVAHDSSMDEMIERRMRRGRRFVQLNSGGHIRRYSGKFGQSQNRHEFVTGLSYRGYKMQDAFEDSVDFCRLQQRLNRQEVQYMTEQWEDDFGLNDRDSKEKRRRPRRRMRPARVHFADSFLRKRIAQRPKDGTIRTAKTSHARRRSRFPVPSADELRQRHQCHAE